MDNVRDVVSLARAGDSSAFATLYEEYAPLIFRFLRRRVDGPDEVVEDLTEDVFVKVFEKLDRYEERGLPFTAWLYRIAHNQLVDYLRAQSRIATSSLDQSWDVPERQVSNELSRVIDRQLLEPALARLTDEQRQAVQLRFLDGLSITETATLMNRSDEAIKKLQTRGLANLRRLLAHTLPARSRVTSPTFARAVA